MGLGRLSQLGERLSCSDSMELTPHARPQLAADKPADKESFGERTSDDQAALGLTLGKLEEGSGLSACHSVLFLSSRMQVLQSKMLKRECSSEENTPLDSISIILIKTRKSCTLRDCPYTAVQFSVLMHCLRSQLEHPGCLEAMVCFHSGTNFKCRLGGGTPT